LKKTAQGYSVSEGLLLNTKRAPFKSYREQVTIDERMIMSAFNWIYMVLDHWNNSLCVDMSLHSTSLF
jgi:hypothetical protein